ncbi:MAG: MFS transporter [Promethearchaeota archaeon]|jgi:GPH family glycoside/pentoside/hexuronide:cation symporter
MNDEKSQKVPLGKRIAFALGEVGDNTAMQTFSFLIFTFYYVIVGLDVLWIAVGFIIWSLWNSINDPLIGYLSDRTKSRWGRRIPWMAGATIPLAIVMIMLFTPPVALNSPTINFFYFIILLMVFDTTYTAFNLNYNAIFSEMFITMKARSSTGKIRISMVMVALIFAFLLPTFIIENITGSDPITLAQYQLTGIIAAIIIFISYLIVLKFGVKEPKYFLKDADTAMSFTKTKNKSFQWFLIPTLGTWIVINILPTLAPLFMTHALNLDTDLIGIILALEFIVAALSTPLWEKIRVKKGARMTGLIGILVWIFPIIFFAFSISVEMVFIVQIFNGIGLGGGLYFYDQCIAEIIDEDEITHGTRRSGIYYAVLNFLIRLSHVINFLLIAIVFSTANWYDYDPNPGVNTIFGLQILMGIYPAIVLVLSLVGLYFYPIKGERLAENRRKLTELHEQKRATSSSIKEERLT